MTEISKPTHPQVSVLIPVYNSVRYLNAAISSIVEQTFTDLEILLWNDGSTDGSLEIIQQWARTEPRIRYFSEANHGIVYARNALIKHAKGSLLAWMDADDISVPTRIALQVEHFRQNQNLVCIGGWALCTDAEGSSLYFEKPPEDHEAIQSQQRIGSGMRFATTMMRAENLRACGVFREPFPIGEDLDLLTRLGERGRLSNIQSVLLLYRQHLANTCSRLSADWPYYRDSIINLAKERQVTGSDRLERGEPLNITSPAAGNHNPEPAFRVHIRWARLALESGFKQSARKHAWLAFRCEPWRSQTWRTLLRVAVGHLSA